MVLAFVVSKTGGSIGLVSKPYPVDEPDTAFPVSFEYISGNRAVDVVLSSCKIPKEISPLHPVELVIEEECQVFNEGRSAAVNI